MTIENLSPKNWYLKHRLQVAQHLEHDYINTSSDIFNCNDPVLTSKDQIMKSARLQMAFAQLLYRFDLFNVMVVLL